MFAGEPPQTGWQNFKLAAGVVFAAGALIWNGWWIVHGFTAGSVETLKRHATYLIYRDADPGWFALNIALRAMFEACFCAALYAYFKIIRAK